MKFIKLWAPVILWAGLIFYFSSIPDLKTGLKYDFLLRKLAHILEYFILTSLLFRAFKGSFNLTASLLFVYPTCLSLLYAGSDELHQFFVSTRSCSAMDVLIDAIGIFGFFIVAKIYVLIRRLRVSKV